jgi:hypothetical protein
MGEFNHHSHFGSAFKNLPLIPTHDRRRHQRKRCFLEIDYAVRGHSYKGSILDISEGGAYVRSNTAKRFLSGEDILLIIPLRILGEQLKGKIARVGSHGMGVVFQASDVEYGEQCKERGRVRRRKVRWEPSASDDVVSYRLYWSRLGAVCYDSDYADVGKVTEVTLPDEIPSFPLISGDIEVGISAINQAGNESRLTKATVHVDFRVPQPPRNLAVEEA